MRRLAAALTPLVVVVALAATLPGCATLPSANPAGDAPRLLVVLPPLPPPVGRRHALELAAAHQLYVYQAWTMRSLDRMCIVYGVVPGTSLERTVERVASDPRVESAQLVQSFRVLAARAQERSEPVRGGGDPYAELQPASTALRSDLAHRWATGVGVTVAVVDTGVDVGHPDLAGRVSKVANFVERGERSFTRDVHGTAIAGVVAAVSGNGIGIAGVAPEARLMAMKACWPLEEGEADAACDSYTLAQAVDTALAEGADVLNLSLTGPQDALLAQLIEAATAGGVAVVAAADEASADLGFPASLPSVIAVRAAPPPNGEALAAAALPPVRRGLVFAPGADVLSTVPGGGYDFFSGSSMAAAHVAGVAALLLERRPGMPPAELAERLADSAGRGDASAMIDACEAVARLLEIPQGCPPLGSERRAR